MPHLAPPDNRDKPANKAANKLALRQQRLRVMEPLIASRKARGIVRAHIARRLEVSQQRMHHYEHGDARPPDWIVMRLCQEYGLPSSIADSIISALGPPPRPGRPPKTRQKALPSATTPLPPTTVPVARPSRRKRAS